MVLYFLLRKKEIKFFSRFLTNEDAPKREGWVKRLVRSGRIVRIAPITWERRESHSKALDNVERAYRCLASESRLIRPMVKLYGEAEVEVAYKKELAKILTNFYHINSYLNEEQDRLPNGGTILFVSYAYERYLRLLRKAEVFFCPHERVHVPRSLGLVGSLHGQFDKAKNLGIQTILAFSCMVRILLPRRKPTPRSFKYAMAVVNPEYQLRYESRPVDFLIDGEAVRKDNTVFILQTPDVGEHELQKMRAKQLNVVTGHSRRLSSPNRFGNRGKVTSLVTAVAYLLTHQLFWMSEERLVLGVNTLLLNTYLKWSHLLENVQVGHYVTLNDEGSQAIGRNVLLRANGVQTWIFAHSNGFLNVYASSETGFVAAREWNTAFLNYDHYVAWNRPMIEYLRLHPQRVGTYEDVGCIWSESVRRIAEGREKSILKEELFSDLDLGKFKIVSFFDGGYLPHSFAPMETGAVLFGQIRRLLDEIPDLLFILKEKRSADQALALYRRFGGDLTAFYDKYRPALDELKRHPRCRVPGPRTDSSQIMAMSDLTISKAFNSPAVEALGAGRKAIFFDSLGMFRGCLYDRFPDFVAHDYDELKHLVRRLAYEMPDDHYRHYVDRYLKGTLDTYMDGKGVSRFRALLSNESKRDHG